jgi:hypothetical protein
LLRLSAVHETGFSTDDKLMRRLGARESMSKGDGMSRIGFLRS